jgi:hypothetical protein
VLGRDASGTLPSAGNRRSRKERTSMRCCRKRRVTRWSKRKRCQCARVSIHCHCRAHCSLHDCLLQVLTCIFSRSNCIFCPGRMQEKNDKWAARQQENLLNVQKQQLERAAKVRPSSHLLYCQRFTCSFISCVNAHIWLALHIFFFFSNLLAGKRCVAGF